MLIAKNTVVEFEYTLREGGPEGAVLETSDPGEASFYLHGHEGIAPGLERALEGKTSGAHVTLTLGPADGFGESDPEATFTVQRSELPDDVELEPGLELEAESEEGVSVVRVVAVNGDEITLSDDHPFAGKTVHFDVTVKSVRAATKAELSHGHVHGPDGHHHH